MIPAAYAWQVPDIHSDGCRGPGRAGHGDGITFDTALRDSKACCVACKTPVDDCDGHIEPKRRTYRHDRLELGGIADLWTHSDLFQGDTEPEFRLSRIA